MVDLVLELALAFGTIGGVIAYAIGAVMHVWIDQIHGKHLLKKYWDATDVKIAGIEEQVTTSILANLPPFPAAPDLGAFKAELLAELPPVDVSGALEGFLRSESGIQWATELADLAAAKFEARFIKKGTDQKGINHRHQQSEVGHLLLDNMDFGDSRMNAIWAILPGDAKKEAVTRIARVISRAGFVLIPTGGQDIAELTETTRPLGAPPW